MLRRLRSVRMMYDILEWRACCGRKRGAVVVESAIEDADKAKGPCTANIRLYI